MSVGGSSKLGYTFWHLPILNIYQIIDIHMAKYVPDTKTKRWVIISPARTGRPDQFTPAQKNICPFCVGNEKSTPPEVYRIGPGEKDTPGWMVRVVPNKFPITDIHEVIIHSPENEKDIVDLPVDQVQRIVVCYRDRYRAHEVNGQVLIFCNHGFGAGASLQHPHSQLAVIPSQINLDTLEREPITNLVKETNLFSCYCPDFSQWPFEIWISPKSAGTRFGDSSDNEIRDLAGLLKEMLTKLYIINNDPEVLKGQKKEGFVYNYYIYHGNNWYLRITPRFVMRAGFELGTGLNVNIEDPFEAAQVLRNIKL